MIVRRFSSLLRAFVIYSSALLKKQIQIRVTIMLMFYDPCMWWAHCDGVGTARTRTWSDDEFSPLSDSSLCEFVSFFFAFLAFFSCEKVVERNEHVDDEIIFVEGEDEAASKNWRWIPTSTTPLIIYTRWSHATDSITANAVVLHHSSRQTNSFCCFACT